MPLISEIRVEAPQALSTIAAVQAGLAKVETQGPAVGEALSRGFGNGSSAAEKAKQSTTSLTDQMAKLANTSSAFTGFADVFKREADMLERIKGPAREYANDLRALDMLLQKDAISTKEYAEQVTNLNRRIGERPTNPAAPEEKSVVEGSIGKAVGGQFGELGSALGSLASKGQVEAAALAGIAIEAVHLGDEYINLSNKAQKFATAGHDIDSVLNDQLALSDHLHSGLEQTMEIYDAVRDGTDELNLSYQDQIRLTQSIGEAVQLSGKSLGEAGGLMQRLSYAFASGTLSGRELKSMMREFPDIAEVWTGSLGKTRAQLVAMADSGKLSAKQLMSSFIEAGDELDSKFGKRSETVGQSWQHFEDTLVVTIGKLVESTGIIKVVTGLLDALAVVLKILVTVVGAAADAIGFLGDRVDDLIGGATDFIEDVFGIKDAMDMLAKEDAAKKMTAEWDAYFKKFGAGITILGSFQAKWTAWFKMGGINLLVKDPGVGKYIDGVTDGLDKLKAVGEQALTRLGLANTSWNDSLSLSARAMKLIVDQQAKVGDAKIEIDAVKDAWARGLIPLELYISKMRELTGVIAGGKAPAFIEEDLKMKQAYGDLEDIKIAMDSGNMSANAYRSQYRALQTTLNGGVAPAAFKIFDEIRQPMADYKLEVHALQSLYDSGTFSAKEFDREQRTLWMRDPNRTRFEAERKDDVEKYNEAAAAAKRYHDAALLGAASPAAAGLVGPQFSQSNRDALSDAKIFGAGDKAAADAQTEQEKRYIEVIDASAGPVDKYYEALLKLNGVKSLLSNDQYVHALTNLKEQFGAVASPAEKFAKEISDAKDLRDASILTEAEYLHRIQEVGKEQEKLADSGHDFASGLSRGWHSIRDEAQDSASTIASSMKSAFDEVNSDIVSMVTTGTADWGKLASTIEADFAKIALQKVEGSIFSAVSGGSEGAAVGVATGTSAAVTMLTQAPVIGAAIGAAAAGAMAANSALNAAASGVSLSDSALAVAGSWAGSDTMIRAANGYAGRVRGVAGTDTKLFAAMVTPGESVAIRTPQQMAAQQSGGGKPTVNITNSFGDVRGELASAISNGSLDTHIANAVKRNKGLVQSLLKK